MAALTALSLAPVPASAAGAVTISVKPQANGGATASITDTVLASNYYIVALTATGTGTCSLTGPTVQIADAGIGSGNPASADTSGACALYNGHVDYLFTWSGLPGTSGQLPVSCTWLLGRMSCTPGTFSVPVGVGDVQIDDPL